MKREFSGDKRASAMRWDGSVILRSEETNMAGSASWNTRKWTVLVLAVVTGVRALPAQSSGQPGSEMKRSTRAGASFTVPASWTIRGEANTIVLTPPEPDSHLAIVDVKAPDAASAVSAAWSAYRPDFKRPVKLMTPSPARDGWEERKNFDYETSPNERAVIRRNGLACRRELDGGYPRRQGTYV